MGKRLAIVVGVAAGGVLALASTASADTIKVTNTNDHRAGSLRRAIWRANQLAGSDRTVIEASGAIQTDLADTASRTLGSPRGRRVP